ncbi:forkhead-associated protein [Mycobacterium talmoniae]|uniref:Forkhead-associated protein n=1 Tax=Mycobacterium talmoniae TaxID=1858794 RepID=A0A1S1NIS3_9MYCO|nr:forkhead-associated protein [Mycobacterium eburneum]OHV01556.1 forkhead-associated protein [Mycobacterium talmoniae]
MNQFDPKNGEAHVIVGVAEAAMHMYRAAIESLPFPEDKKFPKRAEVVLTGLRKLRASLTEAACYSRSTSTVITTLSEVRRQYDDLMARAAAAPNATLGQQLYTVRVRAKLSAAEAASGAGLRPELPDELEAGGTPSDDEAAKVQQLIEALGGITSPDVDLSGLTDSELGGVDLETNGTPVDAIAN